MERETNELIDREFEKAELYLKKSIDADAFFLVGFIGLILAIYPSIKFGVHFLMWAALVLQWGSLLYKRFYSRKAQKIIDWANKML